MIQEKKLYYGTAGTSLRYAGRGGRTSFVTGGCSSDLGEPEGLFVAWGGGGIISVRPRAAGPGRWTDS